jgi:Fe-S-cluster containining protein
VEYKKRLMSINIEDFLKIIRLSLESYCINYCDSKCCKYGKICLRDEEVKLIFDKDDVKESISKLNHLSVLDLNKQVCPKLNNKICMIFDNKDRPKMCSDFPFFLRYKTLVVSEFCPATRFLITDKTEKMLKEINIKVIWQ